MQECGFIEITPYINISTIWGQYLVFLHPKFSPKASGTEANGLIVGIIYLYRDGRKHFLSAVMIQQEWCRIMRGSGQFHWWAGCPSLWEDGALGPGAGLDFRHHPQVILHNLPVQSRCSPPQLRIGPAWTARRFNQSILKELSPEYSLEGLMLKLKPQYFGHLM